MVRLARYYAQTIFTNHAFIAHEGFSMTTIKVQLIIYNKEFSVNVQPQSKR